jgi:integrase
VTVLASSSTATSLYRFLSVLLSRAVTRGLIVETPLKRIGDDEKPRARVKAPPRRLNDEKCSKLIEDTLPTYRILIALLALTGLRISEALGLTWSDIDLQAGVLHVRKQLARKKRNEPVRRVPLKSARRLGGEARAVDLVPALATLLKRHKAEAFSRGHASPNAFVFSTSTGEPHYYRNVAARGLDKAANRAGLNSAEGFPKLTLHDLRHTPRSRAGSQPGSTWSRSRARLGTPSPSSPRSTQESSTARTARRRLARSLRGTAITLA